MSTTGTPPTGGQEAEPRTVGDLAIAAACAAAPGIPPDQVEAMLAAADAVYQQADKDELAAVMATVGFGGIEVDRHGVALRIRHAAKYAAALVEAFDDWLREVGEDNYIQHESTLTDPARMKAIDDGLPSDQWPLRRQYRLIVVKPEGKTPHELRLEAEAEVDRLRREGTPGVLHEVDRAFKDLVVKERTLALELATHRAHLIDQYVGQVSNAYAILGLQEAQIRQALAACAAMMAGTLSPSYIVAEVREALGWQHDCPVCTLAGLPDCTGHTVTPGAPKPEGGEAQ